jgi:hypothetical protein
MVACDDHKGLLQLQWKAHIVVVVNQRRDNGLVGDRGDANITAASPINGEVFPTLSQNSCKSVYRHHQ